MHGGRTPHLKEPKFVGASIVEIWHRFSRWTHVGAVKLQSALPGTAGDDILVESLGHFPVTCWLLRRKVSLWIDLRVRAYAV